MLVKYISNLYWIWRIQTGSEEGKNKVSLKVEAGKERELCQPMRNCFPATRGSEEGRKREWQGLEMKRVLTITMA